MSVDRTRLPALGPEPDYVFPPIRKHALASGLQVWTIDDATVPVIDLLLVLPAGAAADPADRPGLAALTADLIDEGAGERSSLALHEALERIGARLDIDVGADATTVGLTGLARFGDQPFSLLADLVRRPRFEPAEFDRVRQQRLNRLLQWRDLPGTMADRAFLSLLYPNHPYGHLAIGSEASLRAITLDEVVAFHNHAYALSRATLIIVGAGGHEALVSAADRAFGEPARPATDPVIDVTALPSPPAPADRFVLLHRPDAPQSELRVGQVAASRRSPDYHALLILNMVLGGQFVSRLNLKLRQEKGYTYGARTSFDFRRGPGPFVLQASVETSATGDAIREVLAEFRAVREDRPPTPEELGSARAALTRGYPRNFETAGQLARAAAQLALYELPDDSFSEFVPRVRAVDVEATSRAARTHIDLDRMATVIVGDRARVLGPLEAAGLVPVAEMERA